MSLLEDVFLEDEAGEARELERVIEGDEFDDRPPLRSDSDENSEKEDEAEEEKVRVDPTKPKRVIKNPRFVLNPARLTGPRGIQVLPDHFKNFKFKGKGHEREDLDLVLKKLEHWAYRLYPKFQFEDCLKKIETLGKKRPVMVHLHKIRNDQITSEETVVQKDSSDDEQNSVPEPDEFDKLLQQQIDIARATPGPGSVKKTPFTERASTMPKATSSPSINDEQRERMLRNRRMAEERRLARLKQNTSGNTSLDTNDSISPAGANGASREQENDNGTSNKNKSNAIESSDDDDILMNKVKSDQVSDIHHNDQVTQIDYNDKEVVKSNRTNNIDSSDDDVTMSSINGNMHVSNKVIELDDYGKEVSKLTNKKNKKDDANDENDSLSKRVAIDIPTSGVIDLDDFETNSLKRNPNKTIEDLSNEDMDKNENINIDERVDDGEEVSKSFKNTKKNNRSVIDSSDSEDDALVINDPITIQIESNYNARKHNKSNVIDSSDDEEAMIMNESVTVDVHKTCYVDTNTNNDLETIKNTIEEHDFNDGNDIETQKDSRNISEHNKEEHMDMKSHQENLAENDIENDEAKEQGHEKENNYGGYEKVTRTDNLEPMDVDFSDDF